MTQRDPVDVVIVGAGAAASVLAAKLARSGRRVVVLEAGPRWKARDLISSQIWARRLKWRGTPVLGGGPVPLAYNFNAGFGVGGSSLHHYACWFRLHPEDFKVRSRYGRDLDWPIAYDDLRPFYDRIQREVGVSGDTTAEVWRPPGEPYPMPPLPQFRQGQLIADGFTKRGIRTSPMPHAINSVTYRGRPACINDGWCDAGCPIGALANPVAIYLPQAERAGAEIRPHSYVTHILSNARGDRVTGVEYVAERGDRHVVQASLVIVAAFAVQTPRLLLNSATTAHPHGLANGSDAVGRYLMTHAAGITYGLFQEETEPYMGVTGGSLLSQDAYGKESGRDYFGSYQWLAAQAVKPNDLLGIGMARTELFGNELATFMTKASQHLANMTMVAEDHPLAENRVTLAAATDHAGLPVARTTHAYTVDTLRAYERATAEGLAVFEAAGATSSWHGPMVQMHVLGGTIMGDDPARSVTNGYGQTHEIPNLFIAGSGLFPTSGAVNPTFTIHALAARTAEYIAKDWSSFA